MCAFHRPEVGGEIVKIAENARVRQPHLCNAFRCTIEAGQARDAEQAQDDDEQEKEEKHEREMKSQRTRLSHAFCLSQPAMIIHINSVIVTRGLDPRVHLLRKKMDCRVKPGNDEQNRISPWQRSAGASCASKMTARPPP